MPDTSVKFFNSVLNLVVSICGSDPQLKNQPVKLVHNKGDLDILLEGMLDDLFRVQHDLSREGTP